MSKWLGLVFVFGTAGGLAVAVGFSWKQAILMAVFAVYVERWLLMAAPKAAHTFEPYYVRIIPDWNRILTDYGIVKNDEDWQKFTALSGSAGLPPSHTLRGGVWYQVLRNDKGGLLLYRGAEMGFATGFDWSYLVTRREWLPRADEANHFEGFPDVQFFVRQNSDMILLGLEVEKNWWKTVSRNYPDALTTPKDDELDFWFGKVTILLAHLPLQEFNLYWNEIDYDYDSRSHDRIWKPVIESRKKHGWDKVEEHGESTSSWKPIAIKNKYFEVHHSSIR